MLIDRDLGVVWASAGCEALLDRSLADVVGRKALDLVDADDVEVAAELLTQAIDPGVWDETGDDHLSPIVRLRRGDGSPLWVRCRFANLYDDPDVRGLLVHLDHHEVPHRRDELIARLASGADEDELVAAVLALVAAQVPHGVPGLWRGRPDGSLVTPPGRSLPIHAVHDVVRALPDATGGVIHLRPASDEQGCGWWVAPVPVGGDAPPTALVVRCDAHVVPSPLSARELASTAALLALALDRAHRDARLRRDAEHDALTGLPNRRIFDTAARTAAAGGRPWAVLSVDLDGFKPVNDTHGHAAGDRLLCVIADRLRHSVRPDDVVARVGGDEFAVVLVDLDGADVDQLAARVHEMLEAPVTVDLDGAPATLRVGCSVGIGRGGPGAAPAVVLAAADRDLYARKRRRPAPG